jgi:hypothetical protein
VGKIGRAVFFSALTTAVGFLALVLSRAELFPARCAHCDRDLRRRPVHASILFLFVREQPGAVTTIGSLINEIMCVDCANRADADFFEYRFVAVDCQAFSPVSRSVRSQHVHWNRKHPASSPFSNHEKMPVRWDQW